MPRKGKASSKAPSFSVPIPTTSKAPSAGQIGPRAGKEPAFGKHPGNYETLKPAWRLAYLESDGPFGWSSIDAATLHSIREHFAKLEDLTWHEILVRDKKRNHTTAVDQLAKPAQDRLRQIKRDDLDALVSIRVTGRQRLFGFRRQNVLYVLWWDPDHQVYPSTLKHT
jgi:hypothetical protein